MNQNPAIAAVIFAIALAFVSPAFAQVAVVAEPTFTDQAWGWLLTTATAAVPILTGFAAKLMWSQWGLTRIIVSQKMLEKLNAGIIALIRAEIERRRLAKQEQEPVSAKAEATAAAVPLTAEAKAEIVAAVQPKVEKAFPTTLKRFDKKPGSEAVADMIFGRFTEALAKPPEVPHVLSK